MGVPVASRRPVLARPANPVAATDDYGRRPRATGRMACSKFERLKLQRVCLLNGVFLLEGRA